MPTDLQDAIKQLIERAEGKGHLTYDELNRSLPPTHVSSEEIEEGWEGCLSVPDMRGVVPRYTAVRLECLDRQGKPVDLVAKDFFARVIQHETDHLNGIVYVDRIRDMRTLSHIAEWQRHWLGVREQSD